MKRNLWDGGWCVVRGVNVHAPTKTQCRVPVYTTATPVAAAAQTRVNQTIGERTQADAWMGSLSAAVAGPTHLRGGRCVHACSLQNVAGHCLRKIIKGN